jgi:arsenite-transporting ATPase
VKSDSADFVKNRMAMQQEHMRTIWEKFDGSVRAVVPLFETEIRGTPMLKRLGEAMFP